MPKLLDPKTAAAKRRKLAAPLLAAAKQHNATADDRIEVTLGGYTKRHERELVRASRGGEIVAEAGTIRLGSSPAYRLTIVSGNGGPLAWAWIDAMGEPHGVATAARLAELQEAADPYCLLSEAKGKAVEVFGVRGIVLLEDLTGRILFRTLLQLAMAAAEVHSLIQD